MPNNIRLGGRRHDRATRPGLEALEGRQLLATTSGTVAAAATDRVKHLPAAYSPKTANPKFPPYDITARIDQNSDPAGSGTVFQPLVQVSGVAPGYSTLWLAQAKRPGYFLDVARADAFGNYSFVVPTDYGNSKLQVFAESPTQNYSNIATVDVARGSAIVAWDAIALRAIRNAALSDAEASRALAILHTAQYDAIASINAPKTTLIARVDAPKGASVVAAAHAAGQEALASLFPGQAAAFTAALNAAKAGLPDTKATTDGLAVGKQVADATIAARANDGAVQAATAVDTGSTMIGLWRPSAPLNAPAVDPLWGSVTPFVIASGAAYRPGPPPSLKSAAYDQALAEVARIGRANSPDRTPDQTAAAQFWDDFTGSYTSPGHWASIAEQLAVGKKTTILKDARTFALLSTALADTAIASYDAKYANNLWRPISAVQAQADPSFVPQLVTPGSPSYVSAHAAYASAASTVLGQAFGATTSFTDNTFAQTGDTRTFKTLAAAATEAGNSRVWGGVNFAFDVKAGNNLGTQVGRAVLAKFPGR